MNKITHTITNRPESWAPSMGGLGEVCSEEVTRVSWNDEGNTELVIIGGTQTPTVRHNGKSYTLKWVCASKHQVLVDYWVPRIEARLNQKRLQDRVKRGWNTSLKVA